MERLCLLHQKTLAWAAAHLLLHERRRAGHAVLLQDAQDGATLPTAL